MRAHQCLICALQHVADSPQLALVMHFTASADLKLVLWLYMCTARSQTSRTCLFHLPTCALWVMVTMGCKALCLRSCVVLHITFFLPAKSRVGLQVVLSLSADRQHRLGLSCCNSVLVGSYFLANNAASSLANGKRLADTEELRRIRQVKWSSSSEQTILVTTVRATS